MIRYKITRVLIPIRIELNHRVLILFFLFCLFLYMLIINGAITAPTPAINVQIPVIGDTQDL
jgi:hypothetical protein